MSDSVLSQEKIWLAGYDVSGQIKGFDLQVMKEALENTVLGNTTRSRKGGLEDINFAMHGFWAAATSPAGIDNIIYERIGLAEVPFSIGTPTGAQGDVGYAFRAIEADYSPGSEVGQLLEFDVSAQASGGDPCVRGIVALNQTALTSSGNGTAYNLGSVGVGQKIYAALHVLGAGTGTFDAILQSDNGEAFSTPTTRITFAQASGITSEWASLAGAVSDDWWRLNYTIAGGAPSFNVRLVIGIK